LLPAPALGLFWAPDNGSRPVQMAMKEAFPVKATPSCIGWSAGQIECFLPDKAFSDYFTTSSAGAGIFHVLSYNTDHFANRERLALASVLKASSSTPDFGKSRSELRRLQQN
jgi:hypothetical protein